MRTVLVCLVDKTYPPDHSFVTGMLATALPRKEDVRVYLVVGAARKVSGHPRRYHDAIALPVLPPPSRRAGAHLIAVWCAFRATHRLIRRAKKRGERVVLLVRNAPLMLVVAAMLRPLANGLIFQSSFPLETMHRTSLKRRIHRMLYRLAGQRVDAVLAVSPLGLTRVRKLVPCVKEGAFIPLLSDLEPTRESAAVGRTSAACPVRFVYVGTHRQRRRLDVVLRGIVTSLDSGANSEFVFVGGTDNEIAGLRGLPGVKRWESMGRIEFRAPIARESLSKELSRHDVGLSVIPRAPEYREASPTKLAEYMGGGLAVVASKGVALQEDFVRCSNAGKLVEFNSHDIAQAIQRFSSDRVYLEECKTSALAFANSELRYVNYVPHLVGLIDGSKRSPQDENRTLAFRSNPESKER